jgi:hypothetical protein
MLSNEEIFEVLKDETILYFEENFSGIEIEDYNFFYSNIDYYYSIIIKNVLVYNENIEFKFRYSFELKADGFMFLFRIGSSQFRFTPTQTHKEINGYRMYFRNSIKNFVGAVKIRIKITNFTKILDQKKIKNQFKFNDHRDSGKMYKEKLVISSINEELIFPTFLDKSIDRLITLAKDWKLDYSTLLD